MRLLHLDALGRLILTDFRGKPIPPHAILSHRWSDSEILIEDISNGNYKEKEEGYRKLKFCAEQAAQDGLQWDNNERSKAINSMFTWYRNAARCYVFLSDVSLSAVTETATCSDWEVSFRAKLVAPVSVEFFSREGQRIGDKASLDRLLHDITDIPLAALRNCPLDQFSTSERRRWVENRKTSEEEDIVYCLLGVLGVSMLTAYGEGEEGALRRMQAEVEGAGSAPSIIPFSRNQSFVGRELQLGELEAKLFSNKQTTTTLAIIGPCGIGKSQLALEAAHKTKQNSRSCSVFWVDASDIDSLYRSYTSVAQKLSIPGYNDDQADIKQVAKRCVAAIGARQCLLIYDNVEGTTLRHSGSSTTQAADLADFLPHSKLCSVIFTMTESSTAEALAPQNVIALHELMPDAALRMLQNRLKTPLSNAEQQEAMHLLEELSYLPLAIAQAAAHMNVSSMTVQQYQAQLDQHKDAALKYSDDSSEGEQRESGRRKVIAATLSLSMSQVRHSNAVAADYLFFAACVDRKDISLDLLEAASPQTREDAVKVLDKYALVTRRPAESALDIHQLVHQALRKHLKAQGRIRYWTRRTITQLHRIFPNDDHSNRSKWRRLLPHAQYALSCSQVGDGGRERLDLARKCAMSLHSDGRYKEAEELFVQVVQITKGVLDDEHPNRLASMGNLASTYRSHGRWREAEELELQVTQKMQRALGGEHPHTLLSMGNLACTYAHQGRWHEAAELEVQVMQTRKNNVLGDEHPHTLISMGNLASTYAHQGRWREAEELEVQVMQTMQRVLGGEHPHTLISMDHLASTHVQQGQWDKAEKLFLQVIQTRKHVLGDEHPDTLVSMSNLALAYMHQGRWNEAAVLEVQVMQTRKNVLGEEHPHTLASIGNLASTYKHQGRWREAEELIAQVMQTRKRVLGDEHPDTLTSMNNLAATYSSQGRWRKAEGLQVKVMQMRKRVLGGEHPSTLTSINNLASTYCNQKQWAQAEALFVQVLQTKRRILGNEHPLTLLGMGNLAATYSKQGRWREAAELELQVMQTRKRVLGDEHPDTLTSMNDLAYTLKSQARQEEAIALMERCFQSRQQILGKHHPDTQLSHDALSSWQAE
ncbi:kinesin light chain 3 [Paraphaeosphaeria sporulosa]|uniref:Kinesin light chain 3 n=1 Tax=Paraphaeosphaeria sporulosa TaxID=1460663 RepID=A0A177CRD0_9PLEO|nr:kinesin light chain 3 [Paraphaeosphaeria sporulosa]OAG10075.1 kinesin light chain 3 [Paraphaeosphaeria sporulosa]